MLIIVEGVDGAGKTTFIDGLSDLMPSNTHVLHRKQLKKSPYEEYVEPLLSYKPLTDNIVCDRWHVGELIYGDIYRGGSKLTAPQALYIEMFLQAKGAMKLHMNTPLDVVEQRLEDRGEDFLQKNHVRLVHDFYEGYTTQAGWQKVHDFKPESIVGLAQHFAKYADPLRAFPTYVGPPQPEALIIAPNTMVQFPHSNTSSHILYTALMLEKPRQSIGIVPADHTMTHLHSLLGSPPVITLGADTIFTAGLPHAHKIMTAPSTVLRMERDDAIISYGRYIQEVLDRATV